MLGFIREMRFGNEHSVTFETIPQRRTRQSRRGGHPRVGNLRLREIRPGRAGRGHLEDMGDRVGRGFPGSAAPGRGRRGGGTGADAGFDGTDRSGGRRHDHLLGRRFASLSLDRPGQSPRPRGPADSVFPPPLHVSDHGDVRCDHRRVGVEVLLQPAASERNRPDAGGCPADAAEPLLSIRTRGNRRGSGGGPFPLLSGRGGVVPGNGRGGGAVARARRSSSSPATRPPAWSWGAAWRSR